MPFVYLVTNCRENILTLSFMASSHFPEAFRLKKQKTREIKNIVRAWVKLNVSQRPTEQGFIQLVTLNNSLQKKTGWLHVSVCVCVCVCVEIYIYIYIYIYQLQLHSQMLASDWKKKGNFVQCSEMNVPNYTSLTEFEDWKEIRK